METNDPEIIRAEHELAKAHLKMDLTVIDALLHNDYAVLQPGGKIETKEEVLDSYRTGNRHWDIAEVDDLDMKIYGDIARVIGLWKAAGTNNGVSFDYQARFLSIWIKENGMWKNDAYSSSILLQK
jgi:ketosteroid isomerase-like protein